MRVIVVQGHNGLHRAITHILTSGNVLFNFFWKCVLLCCAACASCAEVHNVRKRLGIRSKCRTASSVRGLAVMCGKKLRHEVLRLSGH